MCFVILCKYFFRYFNKMAHYTVRMGGIRVVQGTAIYCPECDKKFDHPSGNKKYIQNMLKQHMQAHMPRTVACPICGEQNMFRSTTNAVQHVESGACPGCKGEGNARQQVYDFISNKKVEDWICDLSRYYIVTCQESRGLLATPPALEWGGAGGAGAVPDLPYKCQNCGKMFRQVSALMQHQVCIHRG